VATVLAQVVPLVSQALAAVLTAAVGTATEPAIKAKAIRRHRSIDIGH
jgi:hypothetical protein